MGYGEWTTDRLEQELIADEELDSRQVATGDGCRSLSEWTASRLDVSLETARAVIRTSAAPVTAPTSERGWLRVR